MIEERKLFAEARVRGATPEEAAIEAGYPIDSAALVGAQLMSDPEVLEFLANHKPATIEAIVLPPLPGTAEASGALPSSGGDPMVMLKMVMDNPRVDLAKRMDAAKTLMPYLHPKLGEMGKKESQQRNAEKAGSGGSKFAPGKAPSHLKTVK